MWPLALGPWAKEIHKEFHYHVIRAMIEVCTIYWQGTYWLEETRRALVEGQFDLALY